MFCPSLSLRYRAPECLLTDGYYTYKMDIWGIGCVFYEILSYVYRNFTDFYSVVD